MPFNLEIKVPVKSLSSIKKKLNKIDAEYAGTLNQTDIYYKIKKGLLKLRIENGKSQLIQYFRDEKSKDRWSDYRILELSSDNAEEFLAGLFSAEVTVKKERKLYWYKNTRIHLDKVKGLGTFLELETKLTSGKKDARDRFNFLIKHLQLDVNNQIRKSYRDSLRKKNK
ncbi:MAG: class IV adenylate cyclase [Ignavibacteriaceae bacterium]|nr:class IV adenylate cyclase [Ignavibacteriaceae bacterium]